MYQENQSPHALNEIRTRFPKTTLAAVVLLGLIMIGIGINKTALFQRNNQASTSLNNVVDFKLPKADDKASLTGESSEPQPASQIVILVPNNQMQVDCVLYGGGTGCFKAGYTPDYPTSQTMSEWEAWEQQQFQKTQQRFAGFLDFFKSQ